MKWGSGSRMRFWGFRRRGKPLSNAGEKDQWECDLETEMHAIQVCLELTAVNKDSQLDSSVGRAQQLIDRSLRAGLSVDAFYDDGAVQTVLTARGG